MSWTTVTQIRNHLYRLTAGEEEVRNRAVRLTADAYTNLPHAHIVDASETIKAMDTTVPCSESVTLHDSPAALAHQQLALDTVVCAADSSLSYLYQENLDFVIDYATGMVRRIDGGAIPENAEVTVWYLYYHVYERNVDYLVDYERGRLRRIGSGGIKDGQELLVDYRLGSTEYSDAEIEQAVREAEAEITQVIDAAHLESTDPGLEAAATYLTLSLLCRDASGAASAGTGGRLAAASIELADSYRQTAMRLLSWFRRSAPGLKPPRLT